jgi:enoyl-CoA hydratase/carnithine racemase
MTAPRIVFETADGVAHIRFDNPQAFNALTKQMWLDLRDSALAIAADPAIRVAVFRGTGGKAFVSGTDISGFATSRAAPMASPMSAKSTIACGRSTPFRSRPSPLSMVGRSAVA